MQIFFDLCQMEGLEHGGLPLNSPLHTPFIYFDNYWGGGGPDPLDPPGSVVPRVIR